MHPKCRFKMLNEATVSTRTWKRQLIGRVVSVCERCELVSCSSGFRKSNEQSCAVSVKLRCNLSMHKNAHSWSGIKKWAQHTSA
jgi:hypothetical protein